jgi:hypothetical protein
VGEICLYVHWQAICFFTAQMIARVRNCSSSYETVVKNVLCGRVVERELQQLSCASTANAKGTGRRLDFNVTLVLGARTEAECAARPLDNNAAGTFVWIIDKLVESDR